jgi:spermidine synthase
MPALVRRTAALLFLSGLCAVAYQVAWLRLLRLVFGASTAASAAVLAIFMGGLGIGGLVLGRRADRSPSPLRLYGHLELGVALAAAATPLLIGAARDAYIALGGTAALGPFGGTAVRLLLAGLVLGVPTFLMGGTLPAAARAAAEARDRGRRSLGLLYGVNTLGAVTGALLTTFFAVELLGTRRAIWTAAALNALVGVLARAWAREVAFDPIEAPASGRDLIDPMEASASGRENSVDPIAAPGDGRRDSRTGLVLVAAGLVGFVFFLMELVWYRMLGPILGGTSYTFGLILAVALFGIGLGGLAYGYGAREHRPTLNGLAVTCALEALALALPFALGDRLAFLALTLRPLSAAGLTASVAGWALVTSLIVLPAAVIAGYQFPLLVGVLGSGRRAVGRQVGMAYAWNTGGAILGALAGGFGLLPLLTAPGAWRLAVGLLAGLALAAALAGARDSRRRPALTPLGTAAVALLLLLAPGPTAAWRHSGIGASRFTDRFGDANQLREAFETVRGAVVWEAEGRESSVALRREDDLAFFVNGKADGSARADAPTQVMAGLVGAMLHPGPRASLVIGLGTGSTAGWLADVPGMERVDAVELEPSIVHVARACAAVNRNCLEHPRVRLVLADGREFLLTTRQRYDLIFSEPSNPYRAGISSLFTREFYQAAAERLQPRGIFMQWLQGYEVDAQVVRTAYATLSAVFPHVESWLTHGKDLLLVASREPLVHDFDEVRARATREPFATALRAAWGMEEIEGFYTGYVAAPELAAEMSRLEAGQVSTDDQPRIEFGFIRNLGRHGLFSIDDLRAAARGRDRPRGAGAGPDWALVEELREARLLAFGLPASSTAEPESPRGLRTRARRAFTDRRPEEAARLWLSQPEPPRSHVDLVIVATGLAISADDRAAAYIERVRAVQPNEAAALLAAWHAQKGDSAAALAALVEALEGFRSDPWPAPSLMQAAMDLARRLALQDPQAARTLFATLREPFAVGLLDNLRRLTRIELARIAGFRELCAEAFEAFEPHPRWDREFLMGRAACYGETGHRLAGRARRDLGRFLAAAPPPLTPPAAAEPPAAPEPPAQSSPASKPSS